MYVIDNPRTKKLARENVIGRRAVDVLFQPNDMFGKVISHNGTESIEGPHYPKPHTWYASVRIIEGVISAVR